MGNGSLAWVDAASFYYTRFPLAGQGRAEDEDFNQKVYFHKLGTPSAADVLCLGQTFNRVAQCELHASGVGADTQQHVLCACQDGDSDEWAIYVSTASAHPCCEGEDAWRYIAAFKDGVKNTANFSPEGDLLYLVSRDDAPMGKIVSLDLAALDGLDASLSVPHPAVLSILVPESPTASIKSFVVT